MDEEIQEFCRTCRTCQLAKRERKKYGKLPPKAAEETMWKRVNVDLWGPKTVKYQRIPGNQTQESKSRTPRINDD